MRRWFGILSSLVALLVVVASDSAAFTYYVSRGEGSTPMGSPANTCTAAQTITTPRLTIGGTSGGWVCATQPGDIVDVRGGTYVENPERYPCKAS